MPAYLTRRKRQQIVPVWDYRALLKSLGTYKEIADRITEAGFDAPHPLTIAGWGYRGRVPSHWAPLLFEWAIKSGKIQSVAEIRREEVTL
jgi:hypothetical protein